MAAKKGRVPPQLAKFAKAKAGPPKSMTAPKSGGRSGGGLGAVSAKTSSAPSGNKSAATGGIKAQKSKGMPAADAALPPRGNSRGGKGNGMPAGATGGTTQSAFGLKPGSSRQTGTQGRTPLQAGTTGTPAGKNTLSAPSHTFASSTIPRGDGKPSSPTLKAMAAAQMDPNDPDNDTTSMAAPKKKKGKFDPDNDGDNDATATGDTDHDYWTAGGKQKKPVPGKPMSDTMTRQTGASDWQTPADCTDGRAPNSLKAVMPTKTREMAAPQKNKFPKGGIIKDSHKGLFTAKAKAAGMDVQAYARSVLANPSSHDPTTVRQANFARNFGGGAKK